MSKNKNKGSKTSDSEKPNNDFSVFMTVFSYCFLIIFVPVLSFFASKKAFEVLAFTSLNSNIYAAIVAVIFLHLALGLYLYRAYSDSGDKPKPSHSQVKQD